MKTAEDISAAAEKLRVEVIAKLYAPRGGIDAYTLLRELQDRVNGRDPRSGALREEPLTAQEACDKIKEVFPELFASA